MHHILDIPGETFPPLSSHQTALGYVRRNKANGLPGPYLPDALQPMLQPGDVVTLRTLVPPGAGTCGWYVQIDSRTAQFSVDDGPLRPAEPTFNAALAMAGRAVDLHIHIDKPQRIMELTLTWAIADAALYAAWQAGTAAPPDSAPAPVPPPETHEQRTLRLVQEAGLIPPLMLLAREADEARFVQQAIESGTWQAMLRLVRLARADAA